MVRTMGLKNKGKGKAVAHSSPTAPDASKKRPRDASSSSDSSGPDPLPTSLVSCTVRPTRFIDWKAMARLGVKDDLDMLFRNMGILRYMHSMEYTHVAETLQFMGTVDTIRDIDGTLVGGIRFTIHGETYRIRLQDIREIYGFDNLEMGSDDLEAQPGLMDLWHHCSAGSYRMGKVKASTIRSPVLRLAQKALGFTFFGRFQVGPLTAEEWKMISHSLRPLIGDLDPPIRAIPPIDPTVLFTAGFLRTRDLARTTKPKGWSLCIGGALTPIFRHCGITLSEPISTIPLIDIDHLHNSKFLRRSLSGAFIYPFTWDGRDQELTLPCPDLVGLSTPANIPFRHRLHLEQGARPEARAVAPSDEETDDDVAVPTAGAQVFGSARYRNTIRGHPRTRMERELVKETSILRRYIRWQGKTIRKMVDHITVLGGRMRSIERRLGHTPRDYMTERRRKSLHDRPDSPQSSNPPLRFSSPDLTDPESESESAS